MKRILLPVLFCFVVSFAHSQVVGNIRCSEYSSLETSVSSYANEDSTLFWINIECMGLYDSKPMLRIYRGDLESFVKTLRSIRNKYAEWKKIAEDNGVSTLKKSLPYTLRSVQFVWDHNSINCFSEMMNITPFMEIMPTGEVWLVFSKNVSDRNNPDETNRVLLAFDNVQSIDDLLILIEPSSIDEFNRRGDLFQ